LINFPGEDSVIFFYPLNKKTGNINITIETMQYHNEDKYTFTQNITNENTKTQYLCKWNSNDNTWSHIIEENTINTESWLLSKINEFIGYITYS